LASPFQHLHPAQIWFFVDFLKPIEISDEYYGEGVEDIWHEMTGINGDGLYAVVTPTDALPVTMVTSNIPTATRSNICSTKGREEDLHNQSHFEDCML
jgi:hypothetical protein